MRIVWESCAECDFSELERVPRRLWMRLLPPLRHYYCKRCQSTLLAPKRLVESRQWMMTTFKNLRPAPPVDSVENTGVS